MKTLGIVGGIGPESTVVYYRLLLEALGARLGGGHQPRLLLHSIDMRRMLDLVAADARSELVGFLLEELRSLAAAGADLALLASNTPHLVFDELQAVSPLPLLSIVEATAAGAKARGLAKVALFGTRFTMGAGFYRDLLEARGVELALPDTKEQAWIHRIYMEELVVGQVRHATRRRLISISERLRLSEGAEGLVLGGTELSLVLQPAHLPDSVVLDSAKLHVEAAVRAVVAE